MKHLSSHAATADNNRIVTIEDVYTIAFSQPIHTESALGRRRFAQGICSNRPAF